jgi:UDP-glucose 4-epimerase
MKVLITGGAGYIGSTVANALEARGHVPVILDSLVTGQQVFTQGKIFYKGDIADLSILKKIFQEHPDIFCTIHCAARIIVPESVEQPYLYYFENVCKSLELFKHLETLGYPGVVFSSSASVYGSVSGEVTENSPLLPDSPYARTKYMMEMVLKDLTAATRLRAISLRYFNPIGSDPQLRSGVHVQTPSHVIGKLVDTALGKLPTFFITGTQWPTRDGSGVRDYIHIWDLANAHVNAVEKFDACLEITNRTYVVLNIGAGRGVTVKELVTTFENVWGQPINKADAPARPGDIEGAYANADLAQKLIGWKAELKLEDAIKTAVAWGKKRNNVLTYH